MNVNKFFVLVIRPLTEAGPGLSPRRNLIYVILNTKHLTFVDVTHSLFLIPGGGGTRKINETVRHTCYVEGF